MAKFYCILFFLVTLATDTKNQAPIAAGNEDLWLDALARFSSFLTAPSPATMQNSIYSKNLY